MAQTTGYNGWANRETWNVALWLGNDGPMYRAAIAAVREHDGRFTSAAAREFCVGCFGAQTPDGCKLGSVRWGAVARAMREMAGN